MRKKLIIITSLIIGVFAFFTFAASGIDRSKDDLYKQVSLFSDALAIIKSEYVEEVKPRDLIYGALKGMLSSLDSYSQFMDPDTYNELKVDREGKFGGLGIEITMKDGLPTVVTPIDDTPAWKAGIKANDRIVKINNVLTRDMTLSDVVKKLRGKAGEPVNITILREAEKKLLEFKIVRDTIKIKNIKEARILEEGVAYIRLVEFGENTPGDLDAALEALKKQGMNALMLDLRNNPGGLLDSAVKVAEKFIEKDKLIVYTKGRKESQDLQFTSRAGNPLLEMPVAVLINEGSASGSEIVAACLKDYKRAIILGTNSFGKGLVQTVIPLADGSGISLTTSKYFSPLGKEIQGKGVMPDIVVEAGKIELAAAEGPLSEKPQETIDQKTLNYKSDNQLARALDVLKALKIYKKQ